MIRAFPFEHDVPEEFHKELKKSTNWEAPLSTAVGTCSDPNMSLYGIAKQQSEEQEPNSGIYAALS